jgi:predicted DNA-binding transcriptional regulator YafY
VRADRLVATLLFLQARGRATVAEVAEELEISDRTARRDLEALATAGVPVYSQAGRGGGWSLVGGARTDLTGLSAAEARALFLVAGPGAATPEVKAALRKLVRALPETFRASAESARGAVIIDASDWDRVPIDPPPHLAELQQAVIDGVQVQLHYAGRDKEAGQRIVHPLGLVAKRQTWYLIADTDAGLRTFRVSRVRAVELTDRPVHRPAGFDLAETWQTVLSTLDERRTPCKVTARVDRAIMGVLHGVLSTRLTVGEAAPDGRLQCEVRGHSAEVVAAELAGFADHIEVTGPDAVRRHLAHLGARLTDRYHADTDPSDQHRPGYFPARGR